MRPVVSSLCAIALVLVIASCDKEGGVIAPVTPSSSDQTDVETTPTAGSGKMALSMGPSLPRSSQTARMSLIGSYRFETEYDYDSFWYGVRHPLSETSGRVFTSDYAVGMAVSIYDAQDGEVISWEYINPQGSVYGLWSVTYDSETDCWFSNDWMARWWCGDPEDPFMDDGSWICIMFIYDNLPPGTWTINCYDNGVHQFAEQFELVPRPSLEIIDARMITPTELGIGIRVTFPDYGQETIRKVRFTAEINGCPVDKTIDVTLHTKPGVEWGPGTQNLMFDMNGNLIPTTPLRIDLADPDDTENVVGRFTGNESFVLSGAAVCEFLTDDPIRSTDSMFSVEILLPVIILHGYIDPYGYPVPWYLGGSWIAWETAYKSTSQLLQNEGYEKEETYESYPGCIKYRTLWDPEHGAMYGHPLETSPAGIEEDITGLLDEVWELNYASKVNFIGHSFGGLVARYYAAQNPGSVNTVITVGSPHLGTAVFYSGVFARYSSLVEVEAEINDWAALRWVIPRYPLYDCLDLKNKGSVTDIDPITISHLFSDTLNAGMASGVSHHCIYSTGQSTNMAFSIVQTPNWYKQQGKIVKAPGDGYITAESAGSFGTPYAVSGRNGTEHAILMNHPLVQAGILSILNTAP